MILIDAGNSRVKWRFVSVGDNAHVSGACAWDDLSSLWSFRQDHDDEDVALALVSCVASVERRNALVQALVSVSSVLWVSLPANTAELVLAYQEPERLGVDRWLAMLALVGKNKAGFIVVDAGSAITIDIVVEGGDHLGGYIIPGMRLLYDALASGTSLSDSSKGWGALAVGGFGRTTGGCIAEGRRLILSGLAVKINEIAESYGCLPIYVCGGDAEVLVSLGLRGEVNDEIVFDGLLVWHGLRERFS